ERVRVLEPVAPPTLPSGVSACFRFMVVDDPLEVPAVRARHTHLPPANSQIASNDTVSGVRRRSNRVPAVTAVRFPHPAHVYRPSATRQPTVARAAASGASGPQG